MSRKILFTDANWWEKKCILAESTWSLQSATLQQCQFFPDKWQKNENYFARKGGKLNSASVSRRPAVEPESCDWLCPMINLLGCPFFF